MSINPHGANCSYEIFWTNRFYRGISRFDGWPDQAVAFVCNTHEAGMICDIAENQIPEWRVSGALLSKK